MRLLRLSMVTVHSGDLRHNGEARRYRCPFAPLFRTRGARMREPEGHAYSGLDRPSPYSRFQAISRSLSGLNAVEMKSLSIGKIIRFDAWKYHWTVDDV